MKKHDSRRGMTLTETLTALAIFSILTVAILYGTTSAMKVYRKGTQSSEARALAATLSQSISDELRYAQNITATDGKLTSFDSTTFGQNASLEVAADGHVIVKVPTGTGTGTKSYDLLGDKTYTSGLKVKDLSITYADGTFTLKFTVYNSQVSQETNLTVSALNV